MVEVRERGSVAPGDVTIVEALATAATAADGHPPFGDAVWRDLADPSDRSRLLIAYDGDTPIAALHLAVDARSSKRRVLTSLVVLPAWRDSAVAGALVDAGVDYVATTGGGELELWLFGANETSDSFAASAGFTLARELWQMRVALPLGEPVRWPAGVNVRTFEPDRDEVAWVAVNNRAFAADPDQSGWTVETLRQREAEPWFDPSGFLLAVAGAGLAGFCWTKLHPAAPPAEPACLGEIYVIGVDPDRHGMGLGRALVVAGLESLHERGATIGMLFVDSGNTAAVALYRKLGFDTTRVDRAYARVVS
jgi:mycothiol synthase